ncbi:hypothetical protein [Flavobacterium sp. A45]|uniref:hypothetical protein n=1 Tax=Flavobacterium sp. A45 TaxID=1945862 RepID=UPI0013F612BB|nr:hypothetical protein [Flavobacterium sp. A45]
MKIFKLENHTKIETGFKTPENYFENFTAHFLQNLPKEEMSKEVIAIYILKKE